MLDYVSDHVVEPVYDGLSGDHHTPVGFLGEHVVEPVGESAYHTGAWAYEEGREHHDEFENGARFLVWGTAFAAYWTYTAASQICPVLTLDNVPAVPGSVLTLPVGLCLISTTFLPHP